MTKLFQPILFKFSLSSTLAVMVLFSSSAQARVEYDSSSLLIKNSDQVSEMIRVKIRQAQKIQGRQEESEDGEIKAEPEALDHLRDAMRIALSRPDQDGARSNLYSRVRRELVDLNSLDLVLMELTEEAIAELRNQEGPRRTATYIVLLENMMAEIKPDAIENGTYRKIFERIRDSKISISDKARVQNLLRTMSLPVSPSVTAEKMLKQMPKLEEQPQPKSAQGK
jgi:hypothetical protein